jgi:hypothetical protein
MILGSAVWLTLQLQQCFQWMPRFDNDFSLV